MKTLFLSIEGSGESTVFFEVDGKINSKLLIEVLYKAAFNKVVANDHLLKFKIEEINLIKNLQKRFEVTKKISLEYSAEWKNCNAGEISLDSYNKFLLILFFLFSDTSDIRFLNTGLKILDCINTHKNSNSCSLSIHELYEKAITKLYKK